MQYFAEYRKVHSHGYSKDCHRVLYVLAVLMHCIQQGTMGAVAVWGTETSRGAPPPTINGVDGYTSLHMLWELELQQHRMTGKVSAAPSRSVQGQLLNTSNSK
jgi:hypothetical protein